MSLMLLYELAVIGGSNQVGYKLGCTTTKDGQTLEILDLGSRGIVLSIQRKQRRCAFVFAYAKSRVSYDVDHINNSIDLWLRDLG